MNLLLNQRSAILSELIQTDSSKALDGSLSDELTARLRSIAPNAAVESRGEWEGSVEENVTDDFEHQSSTSSLRLRTKEGTFPIYLSGQRKPQSGSTITARGIAIRGQIAVASFEPSAVSAQQLCTTMGVQNVLVLMVTTPQQPTFPSGYTQSYFQQEFFGNSTGVLATESLNGFWEQTSYNQASAAGTVIGPLALSQNYTCEQTDEITAEAIGLADALIDLTKFTRIAIVFPVQSCSFGGKSSIGCTTWSPPSKGNLNASVSWLPIFPFVPTTNELAYVVHELGHALGLNHGNTDDYASIPLGSLGVPGINTEYGDMFTAMGAPQTSNGQPIVGQYTAEQKSLFLGWLAPGSYQEVTSSGTFALAPFESPAGLRAIRVQRDATSGAWLWLEYRQPIGDADNSFSLWQSQGTNVFDGALVHYEDPFLDASHTYLLDFHPSSTPNNFLDAALAVGQTWSDPNSLLTLTVNSANANGLSVSVNYDSPCANFHLSSTSIIPAAGGSGTITVTADSGCAWTAATSGGWITFTGATSGQGSGSVNFSISANPNYQRTLYATIQRQSIPIQQAGIGASLFAVPAISGAGNTGQFTFVLNDQAGYNDVTYIGLTFYGDSNSNASCMLLIAPGAPYLGLANDAGGQSVGNLYPSQAGTSLSNSQCTIYATGSSMTSSGNQFVISLAMSFSASFTGRHAITAFMYGNTFGSESNFQLGNWTVSAPAATTVPAVGSVSPASGSGTTASLTATYSNPSGAAGLANVGLLVNASTTTNGACLITYGPGLNTFSLANDSPSTGSSSVVPGSGSAHNSQCTLNGAGSSVTLSGTTLTMTLSLTFASSFSGSKSIYLLAQNATASTAWTSKGAFTVSNPISQPSAVSVSPSASTGATQTLQFVFVDSQSATNLGVVAIDIGALSTNLTNSCFVVYDATRGTLQLEYDNLSGAGQKQLTSVTSLSNSQCSVGASSATVSGTSLTLTLSIGFSTSFGGVQNIYMFAQTTSGISTNWTLNGTHTMPAQSVPSAVSVSPNAGGGSAQTFQFVFSDSQGAANLTAAAIDFGSSSGNLNNSCFIIYDMVRATVQLQYDNLSGSNVKAIGATSILSNSQCTVGASSAVVSGQTITLSLTIGFSPHFNGPQNVYMFAADTVGINTGWVMNGGYTVATGGIPTVDSVTPASGSGPGHLFSAQVSDAGGSTNVTYIAVLIGPSTSMSNACFILYDRVGDTLSVAYDSPASGSTKLPLGATGTASNSQCKVNAATSTVTFGATSVTLTLDVTFTTAFLGAKNIYVYGAEANSNTGWVQRGAWTVTGGTPTIVSQNPATGAGSSLANYTFTVADSSGGSNITSIAALFANGAASSVANACYVVVNIPTRTVGLYADDGTTLNTKGLGTSSNLVNSQCAVGFTAVSVSGTSVQFTLQLLFYPAKFGGAKTVYLQANEPSATSGWVPLGTWTVQ